MNSKICYFSNSLPLKSEPAVFEKVFSVLATQNISVTAQLSISFLEKDFKQQLIETENNKELFLIFAEETFYSSVKEVLLKLESEKAGHLFIKEDGGYALQLGAGAVALLSLQPEKATNFLTNSVFPLVQTNSAQKASQLHVFGVCEKMVLAICQKAESAFAQNQVTVLPEFSCNEATLFVHVSAESSAVAEQLHIAVLDLLNELLGENIFNEEQFSLQEVVVQQLQTQHKKIATAESCTAGLLSKKITEVPGASAVLEMGVVAYANYIKIEALGVSANVIEQKGAVCPEVAVQMAEGVRSMCNADIGVGITGVAGPAASENKPVGLVYIALSTAEEVAVQKIMQPDQNRENVRTAAANAALDMVRRYLSGGSVKAAATKHGAPLQLLEGEYLPKPTKTFHTLEMKHADLNTEELFALANSPQTAETTVSIQNNKQEDCMNYIFDDVEEPTAKQYSTKTETEKMVKKSASKKRFWRSVFPVKGDSTLEKIRKSVFLVALTVLIVTLSYLVNYFAESWLASREIASAAKIFQTTTLQKDEKGVYIAFDELMKNNSDIKAWMKIEGTNINNPVYQTTDNDYYIDHDMNKQQSRYGALFIDKDAIISPSGNNKNVVVYGHHMRDGTMFGTLKKYTDINFYKQHPIIDFTTLYIDADYKVFSVFITNTLPEHDNGNVFNYRLSEFNTDEEFLNFVAQVQARSIITTGVEVTAEDELLTLSTCTYEFDDARLVVMARKVRDGEESVTDTSAAKVNTSPLYPQIWYTKNGKTKPNISIPSYGSSSEAASGTVGSSSAVAQSSSAVAQNSSVVSGSSATSAALNGSSSEYSAGSSESSSSTGNSSATENAQSSGSANSTVNSTVAASSVP